MDVKLNWPDDRLNELEQLRQLIREVRMINNGNHCLDRIARCIELAAKLDESSRRARRLSFMSFLESLAIGRDSTTPIKPESDR